MSSTEATDAGVWRAVGTSPFGQCMSECVLSVAVPKGYKAPEFIRTLDDVKVVEAEVIKLEVKVDASPAADITW